MGFVRSILLSVLLSVAVLPSALAGSRVAIQPFSGEDTNALRRQVARIVAKRGHFPVLSLPAVEGTSQYPGLAKSKRIAAFVVADVTTRGQSVLITFLIWQGRDGSVIGRWDLRAPKKQLGKRLAKDFWKQLGAPIASAKGHPSDVLPRAPTMRINAGTPVSDSERHVP
jgi:hypothetical protein